MFKDTKEGQTHFCEACEAHGTGGLRHTCGILQITDWEYVYDNNICERLLNEDNPQYVLGWNACRYLSKDFIQKLLNKQAEEHQRVLEESKKMSYEQGYKQGAKIRLGKNHDCICKYPKPNGTNITGKFEGHYQTCKNCEGRVWG